MSIRRYGSRYWALYDADGDLVCVTVYKKGAEAVKRRLEQIGALSDAGPD
jgi:hypothetical protein